MYFLFFSSEQLPQEQILHLAVKAQVSFFLFIYLTYDVKVESKWPVNILDFPFCQQTHSNVTRP